MIKISSECAPLVSVIIPVYNCEKYLASAIKSVLSQTYTNFEMIIVDDGSYDNSPSIAKSYSRVDFIRQNHKGVAAARNTGIRVAKGKILAFLDADDLWLPDKLNKQVDFLKRHPKIGCCICQYKCFREPEAVLPSWIGDKLFLKTYIGYIPSALTVRKTLFKRIGLFDTNFQSGEDMDWFARAKVKNILVAVVPEVLFLKRFHDKNLSYYKQESCSHLLKIGKIFMDKNKLRSEK